MEHQQNSKSEPFSKSSSKLSLSALKLHYLSLFPEFLKQATSTSILGRAAQQGLVEYGFTQVRDFAKDRYGTVDDSPYGGGEGMLLRVDVLHRAWQSIPKNPQTRTLILSPQGRKLSPEFARELSQSSQIIFVCGHYEGVDERFRQLTQAEEVSIGDYVLTGGELPALVVTDALVRFIPGVLGNENSAAKDSFENGLLKYPQYTRPREYEGLEVPQVLTGGHHGEIEKWRREESQRRTEERRPDLVPSRELLN